MPGSVIPAGQRFRLHRDGLAEEEHPSRRPSVRPEGGGSESIGGGYLVTVTLVDLRDVWALYTLLCIQWLKTIKQRGREESILLPPP